MDRRARIRAILAWTAMAVFVSGGILTSPARPTAPTFPAIPGWSLSVDAVVYTPDNLWDLIDGAADLFLVYGFEDLHVGEYLDQDSLDVRVEVYRHSSATNAFGMYSQERYPDYHYLDVGTQGYLEGEVLNFFKGNYYVKCSTHGRGPAAQEALTTVSMAIADHLEGTRTWPAILSLLPVADRVPNSEMVIARDFLGYSFFPPAVLASYDSLHPVRMFAIPFDREQQTRTALERLIALIPPDSIRTEGICTLMNDPLNGRMAFVRAGSRLGGVLGCRDQAAELRYCKVMRNHLSR